MAFIGSLYPLLPWVKGWNIVGTPLTTDPQFLLVAENIEFGYDGTRIKRGGLVKFNENPVIDTDDD